MMRVEVGGVSAGAHAVGDLAAELLELGLERVRDALAERGDVVDDEQVLEPQRVVGVDRHRRALDVVRRRDADVGDPVGVVLAEVEGAELRLRQALVRVRRAALEQARVVADRDLDLRDGRVVRPHDADDRSVVHERLHVLSALLLVVLAVDGMVEREQLDLVAADRRPSR